MGCAQGFDAGHVDLVELRDVRQGDLVLNHAGRNDLAELAERFGGHWTVLGEVEVDRFKRQSLRFLGVTAGACDLALESGNVSAEILDRDPATGL